MPIIPIGNGTNIDWSAIRVGNDDEKNRLGNWSSLIGIITAIVGNALIALALNVQRYAHIKLHRRRIEIRERAKEAMKRAAINGYGTTDTPPNGSTSPAEEGNESQPLTDSTGDDDDELQDKSTYLNSPSWWLGQVLMTVGEMGNFLAYGFAPASIVSPLGVVALISNCVIAPIFFGEIFRKQDFWGVLIAISGAVVVVLSAKQEETKLAPHDVWDAITTMEFEIYMSISVTLIIILMWASPRYGNRTILIDLGLVGLFGAYTALSTKGVSSMLSSTLLKAFTDPVTYALIMVLLGTAVMQVRYVNKALQRFDSTQVIPIQFVLFTLSVIIGSAVLYRDFERTTTEQAIKFAGGCLLTFFGVFLITSGRDSQDDEEQLSDEEGIEETINLREQEAADGQHTPKQEQGKQYQQVRPSSVRSSRRSSRASRVSFAENGVRPLVINHDSGVPSLRIPEASSSRSPPAGEASPLLSNPWRTHTAEQSPSHPGMPSAPVSNDSLLTIHSVPSVAVTDPSMSHTSLPQPLPSPTERPMTPRASFSTPSRPHSHHYSNTTFISPSPLSSTVSAVVADALLRGEEATIVRKRSSRRLRPSIRSSLFVPQDEDEEDGLSEGEALLHPTTSNRSTVILGGDEDPLGANDTDPGPEAFDPRQSKGFRSRARSVSNAIGELFTLRRKKKQSPALDPEGGQGSPAGEESVEAANGHQQPPAS